ncbi:MAG: hypothetical protein AAB687_00630 [Patescibacteria group bacterium]
MKKVLTILFFILTFSFLSVPLKVFAQNTTSPTIINARILPTIWYSSLLVKEGESIKIYAGIQNNSSVNFAGTATFYVDDKELSHTTFSSTANNLKDISASWLAIPGRHNVQVKISTSLPADKTLVSYESDKSNINITPKVIIPISDIIEAKVLNTASDVVSKTDSLADTLVDKIESYKKPDRQPARQLAGGGLAESSVDKKNGSVLGAETGPATTMGSIIKNIKNYNPLDFLRNFFLTIASFLVRNWKWSLGGLIVLFLFFKFFR